MKERGFSGKMLSMRYDFVAGKVIITVLDPWWLQERRPVLQMRVTALLSQCREQTKKEMKWGKWRRGGRGKRLGSKAPQVLGTKRPRIGPRNIRSKIVLWLLNSYVIIYSAHLKSNQIKSTQLLKRVLVLQFHHAHEPPSYDHRQRFALFPKTQHDLLTCPHE